MAKSDPEWVEIYNQTDQNIDLTGWKIKDGNSSDTDDLNLIGTINAKGFITFDHGKGWLNDSGGETITLIDNNSQNIDSYTYQTAADNKSFARVPDGGDWQINQDSTKNSQNLVLSNTATPTPAQSSPQSITNTPAPTNTKLTPIFTISTNNQTISSDQSLDLNVTLQNLDPNTQLYIKGAFIKSGSSNYFGKTLVSNSWIKNNQTYSDQLKISTDNQGGWSGNLKVMPDSDDSGFTGTGDYILKAGRYDATGSGPTWSNELSIHINQTISPSLASTQSPTPTQVQNVLGTSKSNTTPSSSPQATSSVKIPESLMASSSASLGTSPTTEDVSAPIPSQSFKLTLGIILGSLIALAGIGLGGFYLLKLRT